ncbi:MAG: cbb3-type cytochrome c oxidase subunit I, partial [Phycisphaerae bacterium]|nr:cbb3-type cytochrome c oxidase subunit I [Phycisphaerae bacterium]
MRWHDHKRIGLAFLFTCLGFLLFGGVLAMLMRWQLARPGAMRPETYNMLLTMHATIMIFFVITPLLTSGFGNYLIPLKIGAANLAMPRAAAASFWIWLLGGGVLISGMFLTGGGASTGWTAYAPLSAIQFNGNGSLAFSSGWPIACAVICALIASVCAFEAPNIRAGLRISIAIAAAGLTFWLLLRIEFEGQSCWFVSLLLFGISSIIGAINAIVTILSRRCEGMILMHLPLSVWSFFITAFITILATPVLTAALVMNLLDHHRITHFFQPANWIDNGHLSPSTAGVAMLWPHLFWFYAHPAVYVMILPAMGIISDVLPVFSHKPIFGYRPILYSMLAIAGLGFVVWGHHLFQSGLNPAIGNAFSFSSMLIGVPSGVETFSWIATLWNGRISFSAAMLSAIAFISLFVIGGLSGIFLASTPVDAQLHNTYFVVAHIHYVLFGGSLFGIFAGIYFWFPKMFGRLMNETAGRCHVILSYIFFNGTFFTMHLLGFAGMPRRVN